MTEQTNPPREKMWGNERWRLLWWLVPTFVVSIAVSLLWVPLFNGLAGVLRHALPLTAVDMTTAVICFALPFLPIPVFVVRVFQRVRADPLVRVPALIIVLCQLVLPALLFAL